MDEFISSPDLERALKNLESFSALIDKNSSVSFYRSQSPISGSNSAFKKIINLAYRVVDLFSQKEFIEPDLLTEVHLSGELVRNYSPLINLLEQGSGQQQKFVESYKEVVSRFNATIDKIANTPSSSSKWVARFLYSKGALVVGNRLAKIELPSQAAIQIDFPQSPNKAELGHKLNFQLHFTTDAASKRISEVCQVAMPLKPPRQTLELYEMKVISLLVKSDLMLISEARDIVRNTAYSINLDKENQVLAISQKLIPIPGQSIQVTGAFKRDSSTSLYNIFLPDACQLSTHSVQSGFPHPSQRHGWALSEALMPFFFFDSDYHVNFSHLQAVKKKIAIDLLPGGPLVARARILLRKKREAFERYESLFLSLHEHLAYSLCHATRMMSDESHQIVKVFFDGLKGYPNLYKFMSQVNQEIMHGTIAEPQKVLLEMHAARHFVEKEEAFCPDTFVSEYQKKALSLSASHYEKSVQNYICLMGELIASPARQIILQQYEEINRYTQGPREAYVPTHLDSMALALREAMGRQINDFHHELAVAPSQIDMPLRMQALLDDEISFFLKLQV